MASVETSPSTTDAASSGFAPLAGFKLFVVALFSAGATFLVILDTTIAHVSIPSVSADLGASPNEGTWIVTSYAVADAISVCFTGWLASRFGAVRAIVIAMIGFGIASALCGLSTSLAMLVFFRIVQGCFGGPLMSLSPVILLGVFPNEKRPIAFAIWAATSNVAPIFGPTLGGYICDRWHWSWIFLINVPLAALMSFGLWRLLRGHDGPPRRVPIDLVGIVIMITWIGAAQFVFDRGLDLDWFGSKVIIAAALFAVIGFIAFLIWELTDAHPVVDLRIFRNRTFAAGCFTIFFLSCAFYGSLIISPLWLQTNMGYTPAWAGFVAAPMGMVMFMLTPVFASLANRMDPRGLMTLGLVIMAVIYFWRGHFASNVDMGTVVAANLGLGLAASASFPPTMAYTMSKLKPEEMAIGSGLIAFIRTIGIAFSTSLITTEWHNAGIVDRAGIVERLHAAHGLQQIRDAGIASPLVLGTLDRVVQDQATMAATNDVYVALSLVVRLLPIAVWLAAPRAVTSAR